MNIVLWREARGNAPALWAVQTLTGVCIVVGSFDFCRDYLDHGEMK